MSRVSQSSRSEPSGGATSSSAPATPGHVLASLAGKQVCPFCGAIKERRDKPCGRCTMEDTPQTRQATRNRIGPWYVLQTRNPSAPGMKFDTLLALVKRGQVTARSIVRGPTTYQLWRFAARVKGLSREFGLCYSCGSEIEPTTAFCPQCQKMQEPPANPDELLEHRASAGAVATIHRQVPAENRPRLESRTAGPPVAARAALEAKPAAPMPTPEPVPAAVVMPLEPEQRQLEPVKSKSIRSTPAKAEASEPVAAEVKPQAELKAEALTATALRADLAAERSYAALAAPMAETPVAVVPKAGREKRAPEQVGRTQPTQAILSARELTAAFRLETVPPASAAEALRHSGGSWLLKSLMVMVFVGVATLAAVLAVSATFRDEAKRWAVDVYEMAQQKWNGAPKAETVGREAEAGDRLGLPINPAPAPTVRAAPPLPPLGPLAATTLPTRQLAPPPMVATAPAVVMPRVTTAPVATSAPVSTVPAAVIEELRVAAAKLPQPATTRAVQPATAPVKVQGPSNRGNTSEIKTELAKPTVNVDPAGQARQWRFQALDSEAKADYTEAIRLYELIKTLPVSARPTDVEVRLEYLKKQLADQQKAGK